LKEWPRWLYWAAVGVAIAYVILFSVWSFTYQGTAASELPVVYWAMLAGRVLVIALAVIALSYLWQSMGAMAIVGLLVGVMWLAVAWFQSSAAGWNGEVLGTVSSGVGFLLGGGVATLLARRG
jgi:hypothetical protein